MMTTNPPHERPESQLLRLLLGDPLVDPDDFDWSIELDVAERHRLVLHLAEWFERNHLEPPPRIAAAIAQRRIERLRLLGAIDRATAALETSGVDYVLLSTARHFPDPGPRVRLLCDATPSRLNHLPTGPLRPAAAPHDMRQVVESRSAWEERASGVPFDVYHGRLGRLGEQARFAHDVLSRRRRHELDGVFCYVPSPEDDLLLQTVDRLFGHADLRFLDAFSAIALLKRHPPDWPTLVERARDYGLLAALSCYLDYMEQIHLTLTKRALLDRVARAMLDRPRWGQVDPQPSGYAFPARRVGPRLYLRRLAADLAHHDWRAAGRFLLLPLIAGAAWRPVPQLQRK